MDFGFICFLKTYDSGCESFAWCKSNSTIGQCTVYKAIAFSEIVFNMYLKNRIF